MMKIGSRKGKKRLIGRLIHEIEDGRKSQCLVFARVKAYDLGINQPSQPYTLKHKSVG